MNRSTNLNLYLPESSDYRDVSQLTYNFDTIDSAIGNLGALETGSNSSTVSVPSGTSTEINSVSLTAGRWIVIAGVDWAANATGYRQIAYDSDANNPARANAVTTPSAGSGKETYQQLVRFIATSSATTLKFYGLQNSGSALSAGSYVYAVKVSK